MATAQKKTAPTKPPRKSNAPEKKAAKKTAPKKAAKGPAAAKAKAATTSAVPTPLAVGVAAPAFALAADDGSTVRLADLKGKRVVIYFYPRDMTPGCTVEACGFRDAQRAIEKEGAVVLGVSKDSVKTHQKFKLKEKLNFPLLSDEDGKMIAAYRSWGPKTFMGRKFDGILRTTVIVDKNGKVAHVFSKVNTKTHAEDVLSVLSAMS